MPNEWSPEPGTTVCDATQHCRPCCHLMYKHHHHRSTTTSFVSCVNFAAEILAGWIIQFIHFYSLSVCSSHCQPHTLSSHHLPFNSSPLPPAHPSTQPFVVSHVVAVIAFILSMCPVVLVLLGKNKSDNWCLRGLIRVHLLMAFNLCFELVFNCCCLWENSLPVTRVTAHNSRHGWHECLRVCVDFLSSGLEWTDARLHETRTHWNNVWALQKLLFNVENDFRCFLKK